MVIDSLYYGDGHHHAIENASFTFSMDVLATFLRKIYKGFDTSNDFEPTMWREILRVINEATVEGLVRGNYNIDQGKEFLKSLAHSNEVFSAFKVHDMGVDMAKKLVGSDGKLKPFAEWKKDVAPIASHYCGSWLQTEYNTAVLRGQFAAEWKQYEADKDIMPNLRWMPTTSATPDDEHKGYWQNRLTLPVEDKFWNDHHPGDHWNCKCSLEQTDDPSNPEVLDQVKEVKPQKGLKTNPGKSGVMFDQTHPYFAESCSKCAFRGKGLKNVFSNADKHCEQCANIDSQIGNAIKTQNLEYKEYNEDPNYKDVEYDPQTCGLKATHIGHNLHSKGAQYELEVQNTGFKAGHKVILEDESDHDFHKKFVEGTWDGMPFEVAGKESVTANSVLRGLKHCAEKKVTEVAILDFPNGGYDEDIFKNALARYKGLEKLRDGQYIKFKKIILVQDEKIILEIDGI